MGSDKTQGCAADPAGDPNHGFDALEVAKLALHFIPPMVIPTGWETTSPEALGRALDSGVSLPDLSACNTYLNWELVETPADFPKLLSPFDIIVEAAVDRARKVLAAAKAPPPALRRSAEAEYFARNQRATKAEAKPWLLKFDHSWQQSSREHDPPGRPKISFRRALGLISPSMSGELRLTLWRERILAERRSFYEWLTERAGSEPPKLVLDSEAKPAERRLAAANPERLEIVKDRVEYVSRDWFPELAIGFSRWAERNYQRVKQARRRAAQRKGGKESAKSRAAATGGLEEHEVRLPRSRRG
jgi:hypothetical protein